MSKIELNPIRSNYASTSVLNDNFEKIESGIDDALSRTGKGPNQMESILDMNKFPIINLPKAHQPGMPLTYDQLNPGTQEFVVVPVDTDDVVDGAITSDKLTSDPSELTNITAKLLLLQEGEAVPQTAQKFYQETVSLTQFGATGNFADDATEAFKRLRDYLDSKRLGPSSGALQNSLAGIKVEVPRGIYRLTEQIVFGPYLSVEFDFHHAEVYYNGPALPANEGALVFLNLSWCTIRNLYSYAPFEVRSCYRLHLEGIKVQGLWVVEDCWNLKAISCWNYYGRTVINGGHQHNYDNCAWEFGATDNYKLTITNPDMVSFTNCYTEWLHRFLDVQVTAEHNNFRGIVFDNSFIDVQTKGSVNSDGTPLMRFTNTTSTPVWAPVIFRSCNFNSIALPPAYNADGLWITADDSFADIRIEDCWTVQANTPTNLGTLLAADSISFRRVFKGGGISIKGWGLASEGVGIANGRFTYPAISKANADGCDIYREGNIGWVFDGTAVTNGAGVLTVSTGTIVTRDIPVAASGRRMTHKAIRPGYYWLVVAHKNGSFQIEAVRVKGSGSGKVSAPVNGSASAIVSGYPTSGVTNTANVTFTKVLLYIPAQDDTSADITWLRIRFTANHASANTTFYGVGLYSAGSIPETQFQDAQEEMALSTAPVFNGNWVGQSVRRRSWDGTPGSIREWIWTSANTWAAITS